MTDQVLDILKLGLLGLLYLFFVRVLWTVWTEVKSVPASGSAGSTSGRSQPTPGGSSVLAPAAPTTRPHKVTVIDPPNRAGTTYEIGDSLLMGREAPTGMRIDEDNFMSARHAKLVATKEHIVLEDLGSRNGTFVNGVRIDKQTVVRVGDQIRVGYTVMEAR